MSARLPLLCPSQASTVPREVGSTAPPRNAMTQALERHACCTRATHACSSVADFRHLDGIVAWLERQAG
ncbi:hypothetical protein [Massilia sp. TWR1-2-2]|uniref:hypothetical protein n=1 Tax=Massilia sp. TWR1-2-2 TaxID=2804584 RepID=UPI003CFA7179